MQKRLEKQVEETAAVVTEWKNAIAQIETQLSAAGLARANAKKHRETHALKASLGDATAIAAVKHARSEMHAAEMTIEDLKVVALPAAAEQLAAAAAISSNAHEACGGRSTGDADRRVDQAHRGNPGRSR